MKPRKAFKCYFRSIYLKFVTENSFNINQNSFNISYGLLGNYFQWRFVWYENQSTDLQEKIGWLVSVWCVFFAGRYFRTSFNKQPYSIANYYLLTCIIKHFLSSWGVFWKTLRVLINAKHKKCGNYLCEFVLSSQTQVPYFSSHGTVARNLLCRILFNSWIIRNY